MILIITNQEDVHPKLVIEYLNSKNIEVFRLNTEMIIKDYYITWVNNKGITDFVIKDKNTGKEILGSNITSVWERRPEKAIATDVLNSKIKNLCLDEANGFIYNLQHYLSDKFWIGHPLYDILAESKQLQLKIANEVGFKTPETIYSNDFNESKKFLTSNPEIVQKSIKVDNIDVTDSDEYYVFWTKKRKAQEILNFSKSNFEITYNFLQEYIPKSYELRVTIICDKAFACRIDSQHLPENRGKVDFRQGYDYGIKYSIYNLPKIIEKKCISYLKKMNLNFGCFDIVVNENGEYIFLECNPNGQWTWIEYETGLPISKAIGEALINGKC